MRKNHFKGRKIYFFLVPAVSVLLILLIITLRFSSDFGINDYIALGVVVIAVLSVFFYTIKRKKAGKHGCSGCCSGCCYSKGCDENGTKT